MIFVENFTENSDKNSDKSLVIFYFNLVIENCCNDVDQNSHNAAESYSFLF